MCPFRTAGDTYGGFLVIMFIKKQIENNVLKEI